MKIFIYILLAMAVGVVIFNATLIDYDAMFVDDSAIALIGILGALIVIVLLVILLMSRTIEKKSKD